MWAELDVASVVAALDGSGAELLAGAQGASRRVGRARLARSAEELHGGEPGDLVITTAALLAQLAPSPARAEALVEAMVAGHVGGIVVLTDGSDPDAGTDGHPGLAPGLACAATAGRLPVIALPVVAGPGDRSLEDVRVLVLEAMLEARATAVADAQQRFANLSLEQLIAETGDPAEIAERAASFGWDLHRPRAVLLASVDAPLDPSASPSVLDAIAAAARATLGPHAIVWPRRTAVAALLPIEEGATAHRRARAEALRTELDLRVRSVSVSIGVGRVVSSPDALAQSYAEAARAVDVGRWARGRHVVEVFDELGLERLLAAAPADEVAEFVRHTVGPLLDHDAATGSDLATTLAVWLETRNMAEAARRTFVHYNTLKNRLERVEAILGPVLTDARRALECEVAMHIVRHYEIEI